jgi:hypothetical protein
MSCTSLIRRALPPWSEAQRLLTLSRVSGFGQLATGDSSDHPGGKCRKRSFERTGLPASILSGHPAALFDDLVGLDQQDRRHRQAERPGGLQVDDQFELGRLHHGQIAWFGAPLRIIPT